MNRGDLVFFRLFRINDPSILDTSVIGKGTLIGPAGDAEGWYIGVGPDNYAFLVEEEDIIPIPKDATADQINALREILR